MSPANLSIAHIAAFAPAASTAVTTALRTASAATSAEHITSLIESSWIIQSAFGALLGVLLTWVGALFSSRKRIAWRAYMDDQPKLERQMQRSILNTGVDFRISVEKPDPHKPGATVRQPVPDPCWLVLLRVRNSGFVTISPQDFNIPLTFTFPGRKVAGRYVIKQSQDFVAKVLGDPEPRPTPRKSLLQLLLPSLASPVAADPGGTGGRPRRAEQLQLSNQFSLNRGQRFELMVVLSGKPPDDDEQKVQASGQIVGGRIVKEPPRRGPGTRSLLFGGGASLTLAGLLAGLFLATPATTTTGACVGGTLKLIGSTAFAPVAEQIADAYDRGCPGAHIVSAPDSNGSIFGLNQLISDGLRGKAAGEIAMSDGPAPVGGNYSRLVGKPAAVIVFSLAVNSGVGVYNLTTAQVRDMFNGTITNWDQVPGGPNLPVRLVSREFGSGTRRAFDTYVLGTSTELSPSSFDCVHKSNASPVTLCNVARTPDLLGNVATVAGAIGYAQDGDISAYPGGHVRSVALNGLFGTFGNIGRSSGSYPFWTVEYLYTYGNATGLASAFLNYRGSATAIEDLRGGGYTPCPATGTSRARELCTQASS